MFRRIWPSFHFPPPLHSSIPHIAPALPPFLLPSSPPFYSIPVFLFMQLCLLKQPVTRNPVALLSCRTLGQRCLRQWPRTGSRCWRSRGWGRFWVCSLVSTPSTWASSLNWRNALVTGEKHNTQYWWWCSTVQSIQIISQILLDFHEGRKLVYDWGKSKLLTVIILFWSCRKSSTFQTHTYRLCMNTYKILLHWKTWSLTLTIYQQQLKTF